MNEQDFYKWIGEKIREFRKASKKTQEEIASLAGIYAQDLSAFEKRGDKIRSAFTIKEIVEATGHTLADLYSDGKKKQKLTLTLQELPRTPLSA